MLLGFIYVIHGDLVRFLLYGISLYEESQHTCVCGVRVCMNMHAMCITILLSDICFHTFYHPVLLYKETLHM